MKKKISIWVLELIPTFISILLGIMVIVTKNLIWIQIGGILLMTSLILITCILLWGMKTKNK